MQPVKHELRTILRLLLVGCKWVNTIQSDQHQVLTQLVRIVAALHPRVGYGRVIVDRGLILEKYVPQLSIILLSIIESRCLVMIVAIVVADTWQDRCCREILLNCVHDCGHGL